MRPLGHFWQRSARRIAEVLFDRGQGIPRDQLDWLVSEWTDLSAHAGVKTRLAFRLALVALEVLPLFVIFVPLPMRWLGHAARTRYLARLEGTKLAFLVTALKAPLSMLWFEHEEVVGLTGYDGSSLIEDDTGRDGRPGVKAGRVRLPTLSEAK